MSDFDEKELRKFAEENREAALLVGARSDTPDGFGCYFELMHGSPLHDEGRMWVKKAYEAHEQGRGSAHEVHREGGKTTVFSKFFLSFRIGHEPHKTWGVIRINDTKANETTEAIAHIIEHDELWKEIFPHVRPNKDKGWGEKGYYVKRTDVETEKWNRIVTQGPPDPTFVGYGWKSGTIVGARFSGGAVIDDIHDEENTQSDRQLQKVKKFYTDTLEFCLMKDAWEIWNFTPWVPNDVYAYIKSTGEYVHSKTPVMVEVEEGDEGAELWPAMPLNPNFPELGDIPLCGRYWMRHWPEMWPWDRLASKYRKSKSLGFARMMLLDLEAAKGKVMKREWLHRYRSKDVDQSWPVIFGVDYASTRDKQKAADADRDYFALAIYYAIPGGGLVLWDGRKVRQSKGESLQLVATMAGSYPTLSLIGVESIGEGRAFYNDLALTNDAYGMPLPLYEIPHHKKSKGWRFEEWLAPRFQMGRLWLADHHTPFIEEFLEEWLTYPNASHDDTLDAAYMGAVAGEGYLPDKSVRTYGTERQSKPNPFLAFGSK